MKYLISRWKSFLFEDKRNNGLLPLDAVDYLIKIYAKNPNGSVDLKRGYFDFKDLDNQFTEDFKDTFAAYIAPAKMLLINVDVASGKGIEMIKSVIHEIFHYDQHMMWDFSDEYKYKFTKGKKLPKGFDQNNLDELDFFTLISFWMDVYGYENAPHEIQARNFTEKHAKEAVQLVLDREKELKKDRKNATI